MAPAKKFKCYECGKEVSKLVRHLIAVHNKDPIIARGHRYDVIETKRNKKKCPLCGRMVTNLLRHLENVEKVARFSDEWKDIVRNTIKARRSKETNDINFGMFADHPEKDLLLDYEDYRTAVQQRAHSTVSKEIKSLLEVLKTLNRSGNLEIILKDPDDDRDRVCHLFRARVVDPMKALVKREGKKSASGCYNKLCALRNFLKGLEESRPIFVARNNLKRELKSFITNVSAALVPLRASKRMRTTSINKQIEPIDVSEDLPTQKLLNSLHKASTWKNLRRKYACRRVSRLSSRPRKKHVYCGGENHKTSKTYGAAGIYFTASLKRQTERYLTERNVPSKWVFCTTSGGQLSSSQAAAIFRRLTKTTATCMRKSVAIAHRESTIWQCIANPKAHQSTIYKGLKAVGSVQCLQESASYSTNRESTPVVPSSEEQMDSVDHGQSTSDDEPPVPQQSISNDDEPPVPQQSISNDDEPPVPQQSISNDDEPPVPQQSISNDDEPPVPQQLISNDDEPPVPQQLISNDDEPPVPQQLISNDDEPPVPQQLISNDDEPPVPQHSISNDDEPPVPQQLISNDDEPLVPQHSISNNDEPPVPQQLISNNDEPPVPQQLISNNDEPPVPQQLISNDDEPPVPQQLISNNDEPPVPQHSISNNDEPLVPQHSISNNDEPPVPQHSLSDDVPYMLPISHVPKDMLIKFSKPMAAVELIKWPQEYTREGAVLKGMFVPSRNKFTVKQLQLTFKYLGGYRRQKSVPIALIRELRKTFQEFNSAFSSVENKTIIDKIRSWPTDNQLKF
ncbi:hypothetical protein RRG08_010847 [Elysia crispata]|uniref:Uncharacterized protein n=1 Tax=Elysia crispata TaxID=231223 RepID=A0AAE0XSW9_9GAST|nr:hypothetical protein RRG08_010847 [Elysia crispata]